MSNARNLANLLGTKTKVKDVDLDGTELVLDADGDSSITADTDDRVDIKVAGSDKVHVTSTGLSIGTSSPATDFHVAGASYSAPTNGVDSNINLLINNTQYAGLGLLGANNGSSFIHFGDGDDMDVGQINYVHANNIMTFTTNTSEAMRIDSSGNLGIGDSSTSLGKKLSVVDTGATSSTPSVVANYTNNANSDFAIRIGNTLTSIGTGSNSPLVITTHDTERMRIDSSGNVHVGRTDEFSMGSNGVTGVNILPGGIIRASVTGDAAGQFARQSSFGEVLRFACAGTGNVGSIDVTTTETSYNTSSDYRLKENVVTDWDATSRLKQLKPSRFNFKIDKDRTLDGFIAHEVSSIVPEAISGEKDAVDKDGNIDPQGIDHSKLVPLLTKALQEAVAKIEILEAKVTALESK